MKQLDQHIKLNRNSSIKSGKRRRRASLQDVWLRVAAQHVTFIPQHVLPRGEDCCHYRWHKRYWGSHGHCVSRSRGRYHSSAGKDSRDVRAQDHVMTRGLQLKRYLERHEQYTNKDSRRKPLAQGNHLHGGPQLAGRSVRHRGEDPRRRA